jgi:hypothetical protein
MEHVYARACARCCSRSPTAWSAASPRPRNGERHDRAELLPIDELVRHGCRALHGYSRRDRSWALPTGFGYRLDHILLSPGLEPLECEYAHDWRTGRLSDHAAMWARIALAA